MIKLFKNEWVYQFRDSRATILTYTTEVNETEPYSLHSALLKSNKVEQGYFLTLAELEQFAKEAFDEGARWVDFGVCKNLGEQYEQIAVGFQNFWAEKKKLLEKNVNEEVER